MMKKSYVRIIPIFLILLLAFIVSAMALHPDGPKEDPDKEPNQEAIMTFAEGNAAKACFMWTSPVIP
jgi:hypothetical protein